MKPWEQALCGAALIIEYCYQWLYFRWVCWKESYCPKHRIPLEAIGMGAWYCGECSKEKSLAAKRRSESRLRKAGLL
jgi:hypothetical protein